MKNQKITISTEVDQTKFNAESFLCKMKDLADLFQNSVSFKYRGIDLTISPNDCITNIIKTFNSKIVEPWNSANSYFMTHICPEYREKLYQEERDCYIRTLKQINRNNYLSSDDIERFPYDTNKKRSYKYQVLYRPVTGGKPFIVWKYGQTQCIKAFETFDEAQDFVKMLGFNIYYQDGKRGNYGHGSFDVWWYCT